MLVALIEFGFWALIFIKIFLELTSARCKSYKCLNGKTAIVTGGKSGIGTKICMTLASRGCKVIIADSADCSEVLQKIIEKTGNENVTYKNLDLASFASIRNFCSEIKESETHLDILIHNAACISFNNTKTEDGLLRVMQVNHFGNFLLTNLLSGLLQKTPKSRLVFVSSLSLHMNRVDIRKLDASPDIQNALLHSLVEYANSKFCNLVVCNEFARRLKGVTCNAVNPGEFYSPLVVNLKEYANSYLFWIMDSKYFEKVYRFFTKSYYQGAQGPLFCALEEDLEGSSGKFYWENFKVFQPSMARDAVFCRTMWEESERIVGLKKEEKL